MLLNSICQDIKKFPPTKPPTNHNSIKTDSDPSFLPSYFYLLFYENLFRLIFLHFAVCVPEIFLTFFGLINFLIMRSIFFLTAANQIKTMNHLKQKA